MIILALDTTTRAGSCAVLQDDEVLAVVAGDGTRTHGERLPGELAEALRAAGLALADVDLLAVARGPGAFTGLRIGLAAMQGLALTSGHPIVGVSALEALALVTPGAGDGIVGAVMEAGRGEVFAALFHVAPSDGPWPRVDALAEHVVGPAEVVWQGWRAWHHTLIRLCGDAAGLLKEGRERVDVAQAPPLAPAVGVLARRTWEATPVAERAGLTPHHLQPLYIRRPDVELARG